MFMSATFPSLEISAVLHKVVDNIWLCFVSSTNGTVWKNTLNMMSGFCNPKLCTEFIKSRLQPIVKYVLVALMIIVVK